MKKCQLCYYGHLLEVVLAYVELTYIYTKDAPVVVNETAEACFSVKMTSVLEANIGSVAMPQS